MQKLSDVHFPVEEDIPSLKELWHISFGDDYEYINEFFNKAFEKENTLVIGDGEKVVSALYLIESRILKDGKAYKAYYVYAVATLPSHRGMGLMTLLLNRADDLAKHRDIAYLFLVPANAELYETYKKSGYETGFFYKEDLIKRKSVSCNCKSEAPDYDLYMTCRNSFPVNESVVFEKKGFDIFISADGEDIGGVYIGNIGCCVYQKTQGEVVVLELFGDEDILLNEIFNLCGVDFLRLRRSSPLGGIPCGMYKSFGDVPKLKSAFIGAYGG